MSTYKNLLKALSLLAIFAISGCSNGNGNSAKGGELDPPPPQTSAVYEMVWSDEFDGTSLDSRYWGIQTGNLSEDGLPGWGNNELQYYTTDNVSVADGMLVIEARAGDSPDPEFDYTSARIRTQGKIDITFGRIEARIKVPPGIGLWAAFWTLGTDPSAYGAWAGKGEIDILESFGGNDPGASAALHYGMEFPQNQFVEKKHPDIDPSDGYHVYAVEWDLLQMRWFIDGEHFFTVRNESYWNYYYRDMFSGYQEGGPSAPFDEDQYIILNMAVGGNRPGEPTDPSVFPAQMMVDYVRVYECPIDPENTGLGCTGSIDEYDPFIIAEIEEADPFTTGYDLYTGEGGIQTLFEGTGSDRLLEVVVGSDGGGVMAAEANGSLMVTELETADGKVLDVLSSGGGNFSITDSADDTFSLFGMGTSEVFSGNFGGDIRFDIKIVSGSDTDLSGSLRLRMDSGFPDVGFIEIPLSSLPLDEVVNISARISEMLQGNHGDYGGGAPDVNNIVNLITFEPTAPIHFQVSNIRLNCGAPEACGIEAKATLPLNVFIDEVDERWGRGIRGFDTIVGGDYSDNASGNHVTWTLPDTGEEGHDTVIETTFSNNGASGLTFIGAPEDETIDLSGYADGELVFDARYISNPNDLPLVYKVDGVDGEGTGEQSLGLLDLGVWQTFSIPVSRLQAQGLTLTDVTAFVLLPTFAGQDAVLQWDNVRFEPELSGEAIQIGLPVDFEIENAFYNLVNFAGGASVVLDNPDQSGINTSATVARMQKFADQVFGGTTLVLDIPVDFSVSEVITVKVWSQREVDVTLKLEAANVETVATHSGSGWEELRFDFTGRTTLVDETDLTFIFDNGVVGQAADDPDNWTFYYDDIAVDETGVAPPTGADGATGCAECTDFESGDTVFIDFGSPVPPVSMLVADPIDPSNTVAMTVKGLGAPATAGTRVNPGTIVYPLNDSNTMMTVRVYSPDAGVPVRLELRDGSSGSDFVAAQATTQRASRWETLEFDFGNPVSGSPDINPDATYDQLSIYFNYGTDGDTAGEKTYLWDTIEFITGDAPGPGPGPGPGGIAYSSDFEAFDAGDPNALSADGWTVFATVTFPSFPPPGYTYGPFGAPNGGAGFSAIATGEGGDDQGLQYLNIYSDYNNLDHGNSGTIQAGVFQDRTITADDLGDYVFSFDAKAPAPAVPATAIAPPTTARAYVLVLDQLGGTFDAFVNVGVDMTGVRDDAWVRYTIEVTLDAPLEGQLLQFGFETIATDYNPSGIFYDNLDFSKVE